ncbi:NAD(P)-dependent oxidoreductase [Brevibacterium sp. SMBL_HHYL_HB1]|uniref:NAD(P)-dependent oxidoreductase n=1 Tax=Brevibacterium sp. SMBL_HHYL_HB1 TaxID=2777556 RepID=UPI001BA53A65|nr:NAD(P)-dependent oxidoreductase [Brevibacterium sp. SMBL_HHYL_HB1]QUL80280.1 NAD(P)-dependent oxidoreductase [Brevibacterium sp. SMBL_HHYL_HB1]
MHILLFGASGHVGTGLAGRLSPNHRITGVVRRRPESATPFTPLVVPDWVDDPDQVLAALTGHDGSAVDAEPVDAVIAAIGGWFIDRRLLDRGLDKFDEDFDSYLRGHFTACTISQRLAESRSRAAAVTGNVAHLALNGVASRQALPGSGAISVFGAGQSMLIRVAAAEATTVDFREMRIMAPVAGDGRNDLTGGVETIALAEVAEAVESILLSPERFDVCTEIGPQA